MTTADNDELELRRKLGDIRRTLRVRSPDRHLGAQTVLTRRDGRAFTRILREHYPSLLLLHEVSQSPYRFEFIPSLEYSHGCVTVFLPPPRFDAATMVHPDRGFLIPLPRFWFSVWLSESYRPDLPFDTMHFAIKDYERKSLREGYVRTRYLVDDREHRLFMGKVLRLLGKVTDKQLWYIDWQRGGIWPWEGSAPYWCGLDAMRWCAEDLSRWLVRDFVPPPDWKMPKSPYYD